MASFLTTLVQSWQVLSLDDGDLHNPLFSEVANSEEEGTQLLVASLYLHLLLLCQFRHECVYKGRCWEAECL